MDKVGLVKTFSVSIVADCRVVAIKSVCAVVRIGSNEM